MLDTEINRNSFNRVKAFLDKQKQNEKQIDTHQKRPKIRTELKEASKRYETREEMRIRLNSMKQTVFLDNQGLIEDMMIDEN